MEDQWSALRPQVGGFEAAEQWWGRYEFANGWALSVQADLSAGPLATGGQATLMCSDDGGEWVAFTGVMPGHSPDISLDDLERTGMTFNRHGFRSWGTVEELRRLAWEVAGYLTPEHCLRLGAGPV